MTMPETRPLLILPPPMESQRPTGRYIPRSIQLPSADRQRERLAPRFQRLEQALRAKTTELRADPAGAAPEQVIVFEIAGEIGNFWEAVRRIQGLGWLTEWDDEQASPDEDFFQDEDHPDAPIINRLFLVLANQIAMQTLLRMWQQYRDDPMIDFGYGMAPWKQLFAHLRDVRTWGIEDRLRETGLLQDWQLRVERGTDLYPAEIEMWFREGLSDRQAARARIETIVAREGGTVAGECVLPEIQYHAVLVELPLSAVQPVLETHDTRLLQLEDIMFLRPTGQFTVIPPNGESEAVPALGAVSLPDIELKPVVALLDGLPLENHRLLAGRLVIDDPEGWAAQYAATDRCHGTGMASLILYGELDATGTPPRRPIYVHPILKPNPLDFHSPKVESMPEDVLPVDVIHRAVRRMKEGDGSEPASSPSVCVINFSIGDRARPFDGHMSPMARLLDWLSWKYNVLFVVSAGNHPSLELQVNRAVFESMTMDAKEAEVLRAVAIDARNRRLLAPAESINALTVGALHSDASGNVAIRHLRDPLTTSGLPSPASAIGSGFRRSVKPDLLMPGGRQVYRDRLVNATPKLILDAAEYNSAPGQKVASPGPNPGDIDRARYCCGTSNATALTTRHAHQLYDVIVSLRGEIGGDLLDERFVPALLKAMLVHGSLWGPGRSTIESVLQSLGAQGSIRDHIARFLGYGLADFERVSMCTDHRVTVVGCGTIGEDASQTFSFPLPPSLSGKAIWKRLAVTLAWLTPINLSHRNYRRAALRFDPPHNELSIARKEVDHNTVRRGTIQHEVLEGDRAAAFADGTSLYVAVSCRADAGTLTDNIPYGLLATLEVAEDVPISIYEEVRARIRPRVSVTPV